MHRPIGPLKFFRLLLSGFVILPFVLGVAIAVVLTGGLLLDHHQQTMTKTMAPLSEDLLITLDNAAPQHHIAVIQNRPLAGSNAKLGFVKNEFDAALF
jgi:hypothetical protein